MEQGPSLLANRIAKLAIKAAVSIVALLMLRGIVGSLPMLKNSPAINDSFLGDSLLSPLVIANVIVDTIILAVILTFGLRLGQLIRSRGERFAELGSILNQATLVVVLIFAYKMYELLAACFFVGRTDLVNLNSTTASGSYGDFIRAWGQILNQVNATAIQNASGEALNSYQQLALAVFRRPPNYYGWTFLILIAIPVIGLVPLVHRNLDALTDLLSHGAAILQGGATQSGSRAATNPQEVEASAPSPGALINAPAAIALRQIVDKLTKLKALLDVGAISRSDFDSQKERVLAAAILPDPNNADPEQFMRLKALFEAGALNETEYERQKLRALQQI
ncbi:MAG TPA: SHOCT domain-containing protein [Terracidiphilus sp.]|jgi:hypothetical protein